MRSGFGTPGPRLRKYATRAAVGSAVVAGLVFAQTFLDEPPLGSASFVLWFATFPAVMFAWGVTILVLNALKSTGFVASLGRTVPWSSLIWRVVVACAIFVTAVVSFPGPADIPPGQPIEIDGRYYVDNHGTKTEISHDQYVTASASWARTFAAGELVFAGNSALVLSGPWARKAERAKRGTPNPSDTESA